MVEVTKKAGNRIKITITLPFLLIFVLLVGSANAFSATGTVYYTDVDNSTNTLDGALVSLSNGMNDTTAGGGLYSINGVPDGSYTVTVQKSSAFSTATGTISDIDPTLDFTLLYSKPSMETPYISSRGTISGAFSHNFKSINLWEEPNYVWGEYYYFNSTIGNYSDVPYYKACQYYQNNIFECDNIVGVKFKFKFLFSDIYNTNLADWHPTMAGTRNFTSDYLFEDVTPNPQTGSIRTISRMSQKNREYATSFNFWDGFLILMIVIIAAVLGGINDRS